MQIALLVELFSYKAWINLKDVGTGYITKVNTLKMVYTAEMKCDPASKSKETRFDD